MKQTCKLWLPAILGFILLLQSCVKDPKYFTDDKLLLSKVTGHSTYPWNSFQYDAAGNYLVNYTYGSGRFGWDNCKPLQQMGFLNTGAWNFTYNNFLPDKTIDNSFPNRDLGYWKYYYNNKGLLIKTGLAFKAAAEPTQFEFYEYDNHLNLISLVYGPAVDTPIFKNVYTYDARGNLTKFDYYYVISYSKDGSLQPIKNDERPYQSLSGKIPEAIGENKLARMTTALYQHYSSSQNSMSNRISNTLSSGGDSNVVYGLIFTVKITSDGMVNPFSQQGRLLFYQTNRNFYLYWNDFFMPLLKSNPLTVEFDLSPDFGGGKATQTFSYTYNSKRYPVTIHEEFNDPDYAAFTGNYIQDKAIEYIKNY